MPIDCEIREGESGRIVLPVTADDVAFISAASPDVDLVIQGLDGKLQGFLVTDNSHVFWLDQSGDIAYIPAAGDLVHAASPYRIYARIYNTDGTYFTAPKNDWWLVTVDPTGL